MTYTDKNRDLIAPAKDKYAERAYFHARAAGAITAKLQKMFGLSDADITMPLKLPGGDIHAELHADTCRTMWLDKRTKLLGDRNLPYETIAKLDDAAENMALRYTQAFYIRWRTCAEGKQYEGHPGRTANQPYTNFVARVRPQWAMCDIASTHLCLQTEAELCSMGLDEVTAHKLNATIIGAAVVAFSKCGQDGECARVTPKQGSTSNLSNTDIAMDIEQMREDWRGELLHLQAQHRVYGDGPIKR